MRIVLLLTLFFIVSCGSPKTLVAQETEVMENASSQSDVMETDAPPGEDLPNETPSLDSISKAPIQETNIPKPEPAKTTGVVEAAFDHSAWNELLKTYVNVNGDVDYGSFKADRAKLQVYLDALAANLPDESWTREQVLAYWINAYNAFTIKLIIDNYPIKSIKDIKDPWGTRFFKLGDKWYNLGEIEHKILRKMDEPRIHFAINCASYSCPRLLNEAYTPSRLEAQLQAMTIDFVNDTKRNRISTSSAQLSNIFKWYKKDFTTGTSLIDYIKAYTNIAVGKQTKITYLKYDWSLNEAK
ncbi:DUF547 domain-containing protein [Flavobacteriaceae bacterium 3-367]|uniref:DUF547 domain-containing protein n=1 Tax=Eudoraea algarum TaxID=3417568 RepID=UPI003269E801